MIGFHINQFFIFGFSITSRNEYLKQDIYDIYMIEHTLEFNDDVAWDLDKIWNKSYKLLV